MVAPVMAKEGTQEAKRRQLPFRVRQGWAYGYTTTDVFYDIKTVLANDRTIVQEMIVPPGSLHQAILEMIGLYNDLLVQCQQSDKNYERDQRTIASLEGEIARMKKAQQARDAQAQAKKQ